MARSAVHYDQALPEVPGRCPWERPESFLVKDDAAEAGWRVDESGRRPSDLVLVPRIRSAVDEWRDSGYPGASDLTRELFRHWFEDEHEIPGFDGPLRFHFGQREAMETLAWLVEVFREPDTKTLIEKLWTSPSGGLPVKPAFSTSTEGKRMVRWRVAHGERTQDLPPADLRRYAFRMATGSGKTWAMAMVIAWAHMHSRLVEGSPLSSNFLIVAPNIIVYERLKKDFQGNAIFNQLPLIPSQWSGVFDQRVILRGEPTEPAESGNLFVTNIQQLYGRSEDPGNDHPVQAILGPKPVSGKTSGMRSFLERISSLEDLIVLNDEAHHVHDEDLAWSQSLLEIHEGLPRGFAAWLDFSATPKDQGGVFFPWVVCDYPLQQAVEDRIVKAPIIVTNESDPSRPSEDPDNVSGRNAVEKYGYWIDAAVHRLKQHEQALRPLGVQPILFIMAEKIPHAKAIAQHLILTSSFGFKQDQVLVIHTDAKGESKETLDDLRRAARDVDAPDSGVRVIVSVMMLREGWDVRNVSVVLGLRAFSAKSEILPEQTIGRGLRLMTGVTPDRTQTLEVLGTSRLLEILRTTLETEGVAVAIRSDPPPPPVRIEPLQERMDFDMKLPDIGNRLGTRFEKVLDLEVESLDPVWAGDDLPEPVRLKLRMESAMPETEIHQESVAVSEPPPAEALAGEISRRVAERARLPGHFALLFPLVWRYLESRCFGKEVDLSEKRIRQHLESGAIREAVVSRLARDIGEQIVVKADPEVPVGDRSLSETQPFTWRRNLPPLEAQKTVFNYVATYNNFERRFAEFLDHAEDVSRFAALAATEQGASGVKFRVDYLNANGAIAFYYPDWVLAHRGPQGEACWIVETKGRVFAGTEDKDRAAQDWCERVTKITGQVWRFVRIDQQDFEAVREEVETFGDLVGACYVRRIERFRSRHLLKPMSAAEIKEAIEEGRE